jgi:hypothetical protein
MRIFEEGFGDNVFLFEEVIDYLLEMFIHSGAHACLHDADNFVIMLKTDVDFAHARHTGSVGTQLELIYD